MLLQIQENTRKTSFLGSDTSVKAYIIETKNLKKKNKKKKTIAGSPSPEIQINPPSAMKVTKSTR